MSNSSSFAARMVHDRLQAQEAQAELEASELLKEDFRKAERDVSRLTDIMRDREATLARVTAALADAEVAIDRAKDAHSKAQEVKTQRERELKIAERNATNSTRNA